MRLLGGYIAHSVLMSTLAVLVVIVGLDLVFSLLDEMDNLRGDYGFLEVVYYLLIRLPNRLYLFLPIAILVGVLIGLGNLAATSELTVMRAAGVSIPRLIFQACKPVFVLLMLAMLASEFLLPRLGQFADTYRWEKLNKAHQSSLVTSHNLWLKENNNFYSISVARDDGQLLGIRVFELNEDWSLKKLITAPRADYLEERWQLSDARDVTFNTDKLEEKTFEKLVIDLPIAPEYVALQAFDAADLPLSQLWKYAGYLADKGQQSGYYWLAFWKKTLLPITVFAVVLLGASFTFGPLRSVPAGTRVFHGIVIALSVKFVQDLLGPRALLWGFNPVLAVLIPAGFCAAFGFWFIYRAR